MLETVQKQIGKAENELKHHEDKVKILNHQIKKLTRKERTHRLCTRGAMLEKILQEPDILTDEDVNYFLIHIEHLTEVQRLLKMILEDARERIVENH